VPMFPCTSRRLPSRRTPVAAMWPHFAVAARTTSPRCSPAVFTVAALLPAARCTPMPHGSVVHQQDATSQAPSRLTPSTCVDGSPTTGSARRCAGSVAPRAPPPRNTARTANHQLPVHHRRQLKPAPPRTHKKPDHRVRPVPCLDSWRHEHPSRETPPTSASRLRQLGWPRPLKPPEEGKGPAAVLLAGRMGFRRHARAAARLEVATVRGGGEGDRVARVARAGGDASARG